jgi:protein ImuB
MTSLESRRVGAILLSHLSCELVIRDRDPKDLPLAVVESQKELREGELSTGEEIELGNVLFAVNDVARKFGVRVGQTVAEARSCVAGLAIRGLTNQALRDALGRVAEVALSFGPTVSIDSGDNSKSPDTVWVDLTGTTHLWGGEEATLLELSSRVRELGHRVRSAIADGPRLARAACAFATASETIVPAGGGKDMIRALPLAALPLSRDRIVWLNRLGLLTVGDLVALPARTLAGRLVDPTGTTDPWRESLELAWGRDDTPLVAYEPPRAPSESITWDDPVHSIEPLLFALRGVSARLSARLEGRGEAARSIELFAPYDRSIAALRNIPSSEGGRPGLFFHIDLPSPLAKKSDFFRVFKGKLERATLGAPVVGLTITAKMLTRAPRTQLFIGGDATIQNDPGAMAVLLAELSAEIGQENVGVLETDPVHRPEARTKLVSLDELSQVKPTAAHSGCASDVEFPTRLLPKPLPFEVMAGQTPTVAIDNQLFTLAESSHSMRFDRVEWWKETPMSRDYVRVWLTSGKKNIEAWVFTDRRTGQTFLHGYYD